jgi:hypothetical protein
MATGSGNIMKVGDLVKAYSTVDYQEVPHAGLIVGFNTPGTGGKQFVHVLAEDGTIKIFNAFDVEVIDESR